MSEWWTYRLSDFVLFSKGSYFRMFELYHERTWPAHAVLFAALVFVAFLEQRWRDRAFPIVLGGSWAWIAAAFHLRQYAPINWVAKYFAIAFGLQALLVMWSGGILGGMQLVPPRAMRGQLALGLLLVALLLQPVVGRLSSREWAQLEVAGMTPDSTAIATLALAAMSAQTSRAILLIPAAWCAVSALTLFALGSAEAWVVGAAGLGGFLLGLSGYKHPVVA